MKNFLLIIALLVPLFGTLAPQDAVAQPKTNRIIDLNWINPSGSDSTYRTMPISTNDTTAWYAVSDSSARGGGMYVVFFTASGDTVKALTKAQWGIYDYTNSRYLPMTTSNLDSLTYGYHTGATTKNPTYDLLRHKRPKGSTHVRFIVNVGATVKQWNTGGTAPALDKLDGKLIIPKF